MKNLRQLRIGAVASVYFLCSALLSLAAETLPVLKVGSELYSNVTVTAVTATDIYFTSKKGVANAKLKNLEPELQKHFGYDPAKAQAAAPKPPADAAASSLLGDGTTAPVIERKNAQAVMDEAMARVKSIVNQPVIPLPRTPDMEVSLYSPGWFHDGAIKPDFATDDVRTTQETKYGEHRYVTSDLNPGVVFVGSDLEFNSLTKYFYTDRVLPKKKLTEAEMQEINRLYRIIAQCEEKLQPPTVLAANFVALHKKTIIMATLGLLVVLVPVRFLLNKQTA